MNVSNALSKQYKKLFEYEDIDLTFTDDALEAIAKEAIKRNTGARGLRGVIESAMLDIMYEIPSNPNIKAVIIDEGVITKGDAPKLAYRSSKLDSKLENGEKDQKKEYAKDSDEVDSAESA